MTELRPCPFCGGDIFKFWRDDPQDYSITCNGCLASSNYYHTMQEAIEAWNTRQSNWISVKDIDDDNLPCVGDVVVVCKKMHNKKPSVHVIEWWHGDEQDITHLQTLPAPPEVK